MEKEMKLGERIKQLRKDMGLTQQDLSSATGISPRTIEDYEQGIAKTPSAQTILLLASFFDVDPMTLLYGGGNSMNSMYEKAVVEELKQLGSADVIKEIHDSELNGTVLSKLALTEDIVTTVRTDWLDRNLFDEKKKDGSIEKHTVYRTYVKETILKYCQNRISFISRFQLKNGVDILNEANGLA